MFISVGALQFYDQFDATDAVSEKFQKFPAEAPGIPISAVLHPFGNLASVALADPGMGDSGGRPPWTINRGAEQAIFGSWIKR